MLVVPAVSLFVGWWAAAYVRRKRRQVRRNKYDGLDGAVSDSSRRIAACRAIESMEVDRVFNDPLARVLAGDRAIERSKQRQIPYDPVTVAREQRLDRVYKISKMTVRTKWFDDIILSCFDLEVHPCPVSLQISPTNGDAERLVCLQMSQRPLPQQVVMMGAGMDTRPWRLALPSNVVWYEIDRADVLAAKVSALHQHQAHMVQKASTNFNETINSGHPLTVGAWKTVSADLTNKAWMSSLIRKGFDANATTVWVAEGLLMYLDKEENMNLLQQIRSLSAPGSVFIGVNVPDKFVALNKQRWRQYKDSVMAYWKSGIPTDARQFLGANGWPALPVTTTRTDMMLSYPPGAQFAFAASNDSDKESLFFVASF